MTVIMVKILLVEDSEPSRVLLKEAFSMANVQAHLLEAGNAADARAHFTHEEKYPDLVFLDMNLPGESGLDILNEIKSNPATKRIPVIIFSNSSSPLDIQKAYEAQASCYVIQPFGLDEIVSMLQAFKNFWLRFVTLAKQ